MLHAEDPLQIGPPDLAEHCPLLFCWLREPLVELPDVALPQELIGILQGANSPQPQLLGQAALPSPKATLRATTRLRRIGCNHLYSQVLHGPAHLRGEIGRASCR